VPTYEYECSKCKRVFEIRQRISEPALTTCDRCGGSVRRLLAPAPFILKGGGWYVTDYPSASRKEAIKSESSASTGAQSSTGDGSSSSSSGDAGGSSSNGAGSAEGAKAKSGAKSASKASKQGKD
jgi:putative FmdB family regulatory protein